MDYVPKLAKNNLYVAIKVNCRVKVEHLLVQCVLVLSISQLLLIFLMIYIWLFQFGCLLIINPRKLKILTQSILFPYIFISGYTIFFCA